MGRMKKKKVPSTEVCANGHTYKVKTNPKGCPDCRILRGLDDLPDLPCDYQIMANAASAGKRRKK